jgi:hypothetical protein
MGETLKNSGMKFLFFPQFFHLNGFIKGGKNKGAREEFSFRAWKSENGPRRYIGAGVATLDLL